jgi:hypothetical protein
LGVLSLFALRATADLGEAAPLDSGEVICVGVMVLPHGTPHRPDAGPFLQVITIRTDRARRNPDQARREAAFLLDCLSEQAKRAQGEARRRTETDLHCVRQLLKQLDRAAGQ